MTPIPVGAARGPTVYEFPQCSVGCSGLPVEGPRELLALASLRVVAEGDPLLPDPRTQFVLRFMGVRIVAAGLVRIRLDVIPDSRRADVKAPAPAFLWWRG